ncbi:hypothetical protein N7499_008851 [Penicillium canescens]|nr:hypothetical protein N7522_006885 [Penicillium canescens]KAJ6076870.1 hypothetical protein N7499_008851 [Penicillium canescens]KAJ6159178.1 hypothetical protein N7485_012004 [Penicillium canescens]
MASHSDAIIIADDERLPNPEPGTSRPHRGPRRDYSYPDFESMVFSDDAADTAPSRKRKRTETEESSTLDRAFKKLRKALDHDIQQLRQTNIILREDIRLERNGHQKTQEELSQLRKLDCKICYMQPDRWVTLLCGHMVCKSCVGNLATPRCPLCRAPCTGYVECYPFAG